MTNNKDIAYLVPSGVRGRIENGMAIIEDDAIGIRVWLKPNGEGCTESMRARSESMQHSAARIAEMMDEARAMLKI